MKLLKKKSKAKEIIEKSISEGNQLKSNLSYDKIDEFDRNYKIWDDLNLQKIKSIFIEKSIWEEYDGSGKFSGMIFDKSDVERHYRSNLEDKITKLMSILARLNLVEEEDEPEEVTSENYNVENVDVAVLCALSEPELSYLKLAFEEQGCIWEDKPKIHDNKLEENGFLLTSIKSNDGKRNISIIASSQNDTMGLSQAAIFSTKMILYFNPSIIIMTGITAGTDEEKQSYGDIIVAEKSIDYASGKIKIEKGNSVFYPDTNGIEIKPELKTILLSIRDAKLLTRLSEIKIKWKSTGRTAPSNELHRHVGVIGSGSSVIDDPEIVKKAQEHARKLTGIEMETYALYRSAFESVKKPLFISFKSISDFPGKKQDTWRNYAAYTSAAYCLHFIKNELYEKYLKKK